MVARPMTVVEALGLAMEQSNFWVCKAVASAHPQQALSEVGGRVPALWLSEHALWPKAARDLMGELDAAGRTLAVRACARWIAARSIESIHSCMQYRHQLPEQSRARRLRREAKLAKELSRLISWAAKGGRALDMALAKDAARAGTLSALEAYAASFPHCRSWIGELGWESIADAALARAERKWLAKDAGAAPPRLPSRL